VVSWEGRHGRYDCPAGRVLRFARCDTQPVGAQTLRASEPCLSLVANRLHPHPPGEVLMIAWQVRPTFGFGRFYSVASGGVIV